MNLAQQHKGFHLKWWGWLALILAVLLVLISIATSIYFQPWLKKKLISTVAEKSKGLYSLQMSNLEASLWNGSLTIDSLNLTPDTARLAEIKKADPAQAPIMYADVKAKKLHLEGINYWNLVRGKAPSLDEVKLETSEIIVNQVRKDTSQLKPHERLPKNMQGLAVGNIQILNAHVTYKKHGEKGNLAELRGGTLKVHDLKVDSISAKADDRFFYTKEIEFLAKDTDLLLPQGFYRLKTGSVSVSTDKQNITLQKARLVPLYTPEQLSSKVGQATSHFKIFAPTIQLKDVDFLTYYKHSNIAVGTVMVQGAQLKIYKDSKNFKDKPQPLPHDMVRKAPLGINIRKVDVRGILIRYEDLAEGAQQTGKVTVSDLNVVATNITNDKKLMSAKTPAVFKGNFKLMGKALMHATVRYNLLDPAGRHYVEGRVEQGYPAILNPILEPSMAIRVRSGKLHQGNFQMQLTSSKATGTLKFQYEDFKIDFLNKKQPGEEQKQSFGKKLLSIFANKVIINTNNMPEKGKFRVGKIEVTRPPEKSIISYWIFAINSGIRSTLGVKEKKAKQ